MADFLASARFAGARPGYVFQNGSNGSGYYRDAATMQQQQQQQPQQRAPRATSHGNFLAQLSAAEARDSETGMPPQSSPGMPRRYQFDAPEWARVQAEGLTEAKIAYGQHNDAYVEPAGRSNHFTEHNRHLNHTSQLDLGHPSSAHQADDRFYRRNQQPAPSQQFSQHAFHRQMNVLPAGGRSNLAGPSDSHGGRRFQTGHGVLW